MDSQSRTHGIHLTARAFLFLTVFLLSLVPVFAGEYDYAFVPVELRKQFEGKSLRFLPEGKDQDATHLIYDKDGKEVQVSVYFDDGSLIVADVAAISVKVGDWTAQWFVTGSGYFEPRLKLWHAEKADDTFYDTRWHHDPEPSSRLPPIRGVKIGSFEPVGKHRYLSTFELDGVQGAFLFHMAPYYKSKEGEWRFPKKAISLTLDGLDVEFGYKSDDIEEQLRATKLQVTKSISVEKLLDRARPCAWWATPSFTEKEATREAISKGVLSIPDGKTIELLAGSDEHLSIRQIMKDEWKDGDEDDPMIETRVLQFETAYSRVDLPFRGIGTDGRAVSMSFAHKGEQRPRMTSQMLNIHRRFAPIFVAHEDSELHKTFTLDGWWIDVWFDLSENGELIPTKMSFKKPEAVEDAPPAYSIVLEKNHSGEVMLSRIEMGRP